MRSARHPVSYNRYDAVLTSPVVRLPHPSESCIPSRRFGPKPKPVYDRLFAKVQRTPTCWLWAGPLDGWGYGALSIQRRPVRAHRVSWELHHGPIPDGLSVLHHCDVPRCVNPAHLFLGDQRANMKDKAMKGRSHAPRPKRRKLSDAAMQDILTATGGRGLQVQLAVKYGVSKACISQLRRGVRRWVPPFAEQVGAA